MLEGRRAVIQSYLVKSITVGYRHEMKSALFMAVIHRRRHVLTTLTQSDSAATFPSPHAMTTTDEEYQYVTGQMRPSFGALLADYARQGADAPAWPGGSLDLAYGPHPREVLDLWTVPGSARGTLVYFHAGYWQSRDKSQFRFLVPGLRLQGWNVALVNYPLCPDVRIAEIVESAQRALRWLVDEAEIPGGAGPLLLCGHSAGAHLAIELALHHAGQPARMRPELAAILAISGVYDLRPLVQTSLNTRLRLTEQEAAIQSPVLRARAQAAPALFLVGATETPAFHAQSQDMARCWQAAGNRAELHVVPDADHFSILQHLDSVIAEAWPRALS